MGYGVSKVPSSSEILRFSVGILKAESNGPATFGKKNVSYSPMNLFLAQILFFLFFFRELYWNSIRHQKSRVTGNWSLPVSHMNWQVDSEDAGIKVARAALCQGWVEVKGRDCGLLLWYCYMSFFFSFFLALSWTMWDPSSPIRDQTHTLCIRRQRALTTRPPGKFHHCFILTSALMPLIPLNGHLSFIDLLLLNAATWASLKHGEWECNCL